MIKNLTNIKFKYPTPLGTGKYVVYPDEVMYDVREEAQVALRNHNLLYAQTDKSAALSRDFCITRNGSKLRLLTSQEAIECDLDDLYRTLKAWVEEYKICK